MMGISRTTLREALRILEEQRFIRKRRGLGTFVMERAIIKDMSQIVPPFVQMLMFLSPVLYPASAVPEVLRPFYQFNPLGIVIETCRNVVIGESIAWSAWCAALLLGVAVAWLGHLFFRHSREEFADVL